jgi:hypothetical protein
VNEEQIAGVQARLRSVLGAKMQEMQLEAAEPLQKVYRELELSWYLEQLGLRWLATCMDIQTPNRRDQRLIPCGPAGLDLLSGRGLQGRQEPGEEPGQRQLDIRSALARYSAELKLVTISGEKSGDLDHAALWLRWTFSELAPAAVLYHRELYRQAIQQLEGASIPESPPCAANVCPQHRPRPRRPRVACETHPEFAIRNPAYVRFRQRGAALYADARELYRLCLMRLGEQQLSAPLPEANAVIEPWRHVLDLAAEAEEGTDDVSVMRSHINTRCQSLAKRVGGTTSSTQISYSTVSRTC